MDQPTGPPHGLHPSWLQAAAQLIKNSMDKKFGAYWHCAIGEGFGFDITYQQRNMIYVFYGSIGVLTYKCVTPTNRNQLRVRVNPASSRVGASTAGTASTRWIPIHFLRYS